MDDSSLWWDLFGGRLPPWVDCLMSTKSRRAKKARRRVAAFYRAVKYTLRSLKPRDVTDLYVHPRIFARMPVSSGTFSWPQQHVFVSERIPETMQDEETGEQVPVAWKVDRSYFEVTR